ncbi:MAG: hypothetical protein CM1200mP30_17270 [Pseudomonadota bacterium]|nr:MAG: hypothetical protein CM1200mP30_17270 [Pseudomonadota bacterium]
MLSPAMVKRLEQHWSNTLRQRSNVYRFSGNRAQSFGQCCSNIQIYVLELGGKNPIIIFPDADLERLPIMLLRELSKTLAKSVSPISRFILHQV